MYLYRHLNKNANSYKIIRLIKDNYNFFLPIKKDLKMIDLGNNKIYIADSDKSAKPLINLIRTKLQGFDNFFFVHLSIVGLGFRIRKYVKSNKCFLRIELGFSHYIYYPLPDTVKILKGRKKILLISPEFNTLQRVCFQLINLRKHNPYKPKGIVLTTKNFKFKSGKKSQK